MIKFIPINNPRTPEDGWEDEVYGCHGCGCITSAYLGIEFKMLGASLIIVKLCKGCLNEGEKIINRLILGQAEKRV